MTAFPSLRRIAKALAISSAVAAWPTVFAIPAAIGGAPALLLFIAIGFGIALGHALLLGLPLYLLLVRSGVAPGGFAMLAGGLIGALPTSLLIAATTQAATLTNLLLLALLFGFCGMLGGATFDFVVTRAGEPA
jgi:hypothetical protein